MLSLVTTADGSSTIFNSKVGEHYHSRHGALQESRHVFLDSGLRFFLAGHPVKEVSIVEVGFGTGLNFLLTAGYCTEHGIKLEYTGIEAFPLDRELLEQTGYHQYVANDIWRAFIENYPAALKDAAELNNYCSFRIAETPLLDFSTSAQFDIIYFDAFAAVHQPEMWDDRAIGHITQFLKPSGVFVTYAITGNLKRTMKSLGFTVEKAPGAPGKREMLRAIR